MGQDPVAIREAIEETRLRLGDTVEALSYKTDIKSRAQETAVELKHKAQTSAVTLGQTVRARLRERRVQIGLALAGSTAVAAAVGVVCGGRALAERRGDRLARPARKLPEGARRAVLPAAKTADRWLADTTKDLRHTFQERRTGAVRGISEEIARALAEEQQRRNPFWRKAARDAASAAATTAATLAVRRAFHRESVGKAAA